MCTIAILVRVTDAPLVIAANRDEVYARPTRPPERLGDGLAGGVDELSGGTWLALARAGRFAAVTNQRVMEPPPPGLRSRGLAVRELAATVDQDAYATAIDPERYASMNLVWGDAARVRVGYFRRETNEREIVTLAPGVHVLCNDKLGSPGFPRGERLAQIIGELLARKLPLAELIADLEHALADRHVSAPADVPPSKFPADFARELTAICIHGGAYGTRSSTVAAFAPGRVLAYDHADGPPDETAYRDRLELLR